MINEYKTYKVQYTLEQYKTETVSPYTGKPYKKPQRHTHWIEITEYIKAKNIHNALDDSLSRAKTMKWELDLVEEVEPFEKIPQPLNIRMV